MPSVTLTMDKTEAKALVKAVRRALRTIRDECPEVPLDDLWPLEWLIGFVEPDGKDWS